MTNKKTAHNGYPNTPAPPATAKIPISKWGVA
eukprot:COSAG01_NODE_79851_length_126_cov_24.703704_1_plen_31_part_01